MKTEDIFSNIHFDLDNNKIVFEDFFSDGQYQPPQNTVLSPIERRKVEGYIKTFISENTSKISERVYRRDLRYSLLGKRTVRMNKKSGEKLIYNLIVI